MNRRTFIKSSLAATAALSTTSWLGCTATKPTARIRGANEDLRVAVAGLNGRGRALVEGFAKLPGVRVVALCDVDTQVLGRYTQKLREEGKPVVGYQDIRRILDDPEIDVVGYATPNHWHALNAIWTVQAGKDAYVEKPLSHNVWEGRKVVQAAQKYGRMVQTGSQIRSSTGIQEAMAWIQAGNLGKIVCARGFCYKRRDSLGRADQPLEIPATIDANLWFGPAQVEPLMRKRLHYDWHWVWPTGNGDLGNQGVHQMDLCAWALGVRELSPRVLSVGGRLGYVDDGTTPNTQIVFHDYQPAPLIFEVRGLPADPRGASLNQMDRYRGVDIGAIIDCEGGSLIITSYSNATAVDRTGQEIRKFTGGGDHFANFIQAVRSRKTSALAADAQVGHVSAALCHTGNISQRVGQTHSPAQIRDAVKTNPTMSEAFGRLEEHLGRNNVNLSETPIALGPLLEINPRTERFTNHRAANQLLTRNYRRPFAVPERV